MERKDFSHIEKQVADAGNLKESLDTAVSQYETFCEKRRASRRIRMELNFYSGDRDVYHGCLNCTDIPMELVCLLDLILKERRDQLQKRFDELQIEITTA